MPLRGQPIERKIGENLSEAGSWDAYLDFLSHFRIIVRLDYAVAIFRDSMGAMAMLGHLLFGKPLVYRCRGTRRTIDLYTLELEKKNSPGGKKHFMAQKVASSVCEFVIPEVAKPLTFAIEKRSLRGKIEYYSSLEMCMTASRRTYHWHPAL